MPIQWRETMSVDRGPIDRDHRHLIGIINEFEGVAAQSAALRQMLGLLDKLDEYARQHFSREEEFQRSVSYPLHENHYLEHQRLVHELARIRSEFEAVQDGRIVAAHARLAGLLRRWLVNHVVKLDLGMRPYVDASGAGHVMAPHRTSSLHGLRILVVDDGQPFVRNTMLSILRVVCRTFDITTATHGNWALHLEGGVPPELILCDINLELQEAPQFIGELRGHPSPDVRAATVIALAAHDDDPIVQEAARLNIRACLVKPVSPARVEQTLAEVFRGRQPVGNGKRPAVVGCSW